MVVDGGQATEIAGVTADGGRMTEIVGVVLDGVKAISTAENDREANAIVGAIAQKVEVKETGDSPVMPQDAKTR